jgi:hypothetical protein
VTIISRRNVTATVRRSGLFVIGPIVKNESRLDV